ncbi:hypothetical protein [Luteibacter yeojuensis]|uniref:hypothetical protein n=1 Tax=Luteibacter yeojuensis TaxID=345309 RepID=UPI0012EEBCCB|nr:hypothetical protein [Luteibacter yeojuensis]
MTVAPSLQKKTALEKIWLTAYLRALKRLPPLLAEREADLAANIFHKRFSPLPSIKDAMASGFLDV